MVLNNTRVIPARLFGQRAGVHSQAPSKATRREHLTGNVEVLLTRQLDPDIWEALVRPGRKMRIGERVRFGGEAGEGGSWRREILTRGIGVADVEVSSRRRGVEPLLDRLGHIPLPPYIDRRMKSGSGAVPDGLCQERGAIAAPTAGLHFTPEVLERYDGAALRFASLR